MRFAVGVAAVAALASSADAFLAQPNALLGARSNVARVSQRGPQMLGVALPSARAMPLALAPAMATKPAQTVTRMASTAGETKKGGVDVQLICYFALWYLGNYYYNISNKMALTAAGGAAGFPLTIATLQLAVGCVYGLFLWAAPDARALPTTTKDDILKIIPVAFCSAAAHSFSVFALSSGSVSFGQIVKAAEPAFAALLGVTIYKKSISNGKWLCLIPIIGGVVLASVKELDFAWSALITACLANLFAAFKGQENQKLMSAPGIKERIGSVGNQFALTMLLGTLISIPFMIAKEGAKWGEFVTTFNTNPIVSFNLIASGLWFYGYNELATMTIKKTSAVTQSVANTAKRVIVIVGVAIVLGESLEPLKLLGCAIGIGGVFLYSVIDMIFPPKK